MNDSKVLHLLSNLAKLAEGSKLGMSFLKEAIQYYAELAFRLKVTPKQATLLSVCFKLQLMHASIPIDYDSIATYLDVDNIDALDYCSDIEALVHAGFLKWRNAISENVFEIPEKVSSAFKHNTIPDPQKTTGLDIRELFMFMEEKFTDLYNDSLAPMALYYELQKIFALNRHLSFVRELDNLRIENENDWMMLVLMCHCHVNRGEARITNRHLVKAFPTHFAFYASKARLNNGTHFLLQEGLVEHECEDGIADMNVIRLTNKAKVLLLSEVQDQSVLHSYSGLKSPETLERKEMFYTKANKKQVEELRLLLGKKKYNEIRSRMMEKGFRTGLTILFYGGPGLGKTETVNQLSIDTGREIMQVNIPDIRSKWVGESERNISDVFKRYRSIVENSEVAPILLFNEADGIFGIRHEGATTATDKMENSIQNIILQEMESLDGIMIATTNLTQNLDPAFERRFFYKIEFEKPDSNVCQQIVHSMMPDLTEEECALVGQYGFSGGQLENIVRKLVSYEVMNGSDYPRMETIRSFCESERIGNSKIFKKIGF